MVSRARVNAAAVSMTADQLTVLLVEKVMAWRIAPGRFLMNGRRWLPRWRFRPTKILGDAFRLLEKADVVEYALGTGRNRTYWVKVRTSDASAEASGSSLP